MRFIFILRNMSLRSHAMILLGFAVLLAMAPVSGIRLIAQQSTIPAGQLDAARNPSELKLPARTFPLTEQYIWTEVDREPAPRTPKEENGRWEFRRVFPLSVVPRQATLYVAASGDVEVWLNGKQLLVYSDDRTLRPGYTVHALDVGTFLQAGKMHWQSASRNCTARITPPPIL